MVYVNIMINYFPFDEEGSKHSVNFFVRFTTLSFGLGLCTWFCSVSNIGDLYCNGPSASFRCHLDTTQEK